MNDTSKESLLAALDSMEDAILVEGWQSAPPPAATSKPPTQWPPRAPEVVVANAPAPRAVASVATARLREELPTYPDQRPRPVGVTPVRGSTAEVMARFRWVG